MAQPSVRAMARLNEVFYCALRHPVCQPGPAKIIQMDDTRAHLLNCKVLQPIFIKQPHAPY